MAGELTLAQRIKAKYPKIYDDLPDAELEAKILAKYPGTYDDLPRTKAAEAAPTKAAEVKPTSAKTETGSFLPGPGEFARRMGRQLVSPVAPIKKLARKAATAIEGVERPESTANFGETLRGAAASIKESPVAGTAQALWGLSGIPAIAELLRSGAAAAPAFMEQPVAAMRGFGAGVVEGVGNLSPAEALMLRIGGKKKAAIGKARAEAPPKPKPVEAGLDSSLAPTLKGKTGKVPIKTEGYADPYIRAAEAQYLTAKTKALESTKGAIPEGDPIADVIAELSKPDAVTRSELPPSDLPAKPELMGWESTQHPVSTLEGRESVSPGRAIPEPAGLVGFAEESGAAAQAAFRRNRAIKRQRDAAIDAEIQRQLLGHQAAATGRRRALGQGLREPKIDLPLTEGGPVVETPRVASVAELDDFLRNRQAAVRATPGVGAAVEPPAKVSTAPGPTGGVTAPVATSAEIAVKRRNLLQKVKKLETGNSALDKKLTRFNYLIGQQKDGILSTERAVEMAKLEKEILANEALPVSIKKSWTRMNEAAAGRPTEPVSKKAEAIPAADRPVATHDARGIRIPTSQQREFRAQMDRITEAKAKEASPREAAAADAMERMIARTDAVEAEMARNRAAQIAKDKGKWAPGAAVDLSKRATPTPGSMEELATMPRAQRLSAKPVVEPPIETPRAAESITARSEELMAKIVPPEPEPVPIPPEVISEARQMALTSLRNQTPFIRPGGVNPASVETMRASLTSNPIVDVLRELQGETPEGALATSTSGQRLDVNDPRAYKIGIRPPKQPSVKLPVEARGLLEFPKGIQTLRREKGIRTERDKISEMQTRFRGKAGSKAEPAKSAEVVKTTKTVMEQKAEAKLTELQAAQAQEFAKGAPHGMDPDTWEAMQAIEKTARDTYASEGILDPRLVNDLRRFWGSQSTADRLGISRGLVEQLSGAPHRQRPLKAIIEESDRRYKFMIDNPDGFANVEAMAAMTGGAAGALIGGTIEGEDALDRVSYMIAGALIGGRIGYGGARALQGHKFGTTKGNVEALDTANMLAGPAAIKASLGSLGAVAAAAQEARAMGNAAGARRGLNFMRTEAPGMWWKIVTGPTANLNRSSTWVQNVTTGAGATGLPQKILMNVMRPFIASDTVATAAMRRMGMSPEEINRLMLQGTPTTHVGQQGLRLAQHNMAFRLFAKFPRTRIGSLERAIEYTPGINRIKKFSTRTQSPDLGFKPQEQLSSAQLKARARFGGTAMLVGTAYGYWGDPGPIMGGVMSAAAGPAAVPVMASIAAGKALKAGKDPLVEAVWSAVSSVPQVQEADIRGLFPNPNSPGGSWIPRRFRPGGAAKRAAQAAGLISE